jgi:hypothetical protein
MELSFVMEGAEGKAFGASLDAWWVPGIFPSSLLLSHPGAKREIPAKKQKKIKGFFMIRVPPKKRATSRLLPTGDHRVSSSD